MIFQGWRGRSRALVGALLAGLALFWCVVRFVGLAKSPHGFFGDETLGAVHVICLSQRGPGAGKPWPLFAGGGAGGFYSPPYLYSALAWTHLFGHSIPSFRAMAAFFNVMTIAGLALIAHRLGGRLLALTTAVAAALSPWSFQFSRIAWDPPLAPAFIVWGTYLLLRAPRPFASLLAGLAFALAMYAYPPARVQAPLWLWILLLVLWQRGKLTRGSLFAALGSMTLASIPLVVLTRNGTLTTRISELSIIGSKWTEQQRGTTPEPLFVLRTFLDNLHAHLRPSYLFFSGDGNLRHSTQGVGELGPVDALALGLLVVAGAHSMASRLFPRSVSAPSAPVDAADLRLGCLAVVGAVLGTLPAAFTWDGVPHALRSIGTWPFVVFMSGLVLARAWERSAWVGPILLLVGVVYSALFLPFYFFRAYQNAAPMWFHRDLQEAVEATPHRSAREALQPFVAAPGYSRAELEFYLMEYDHLECVEAERVSRAMWPGDP